MDQNDTVKIGYDIVFYHTIGLMDDVLIRMVKDLLNIKEDYRKVEIFRDAKRYVGCPLIVSFDDVLFVDVRLHFDNRCGMLEKNIFDSIQAFFTIFDNTYGLREDRYKYIMLDLTRLDKKVVYDQVHFGSFISENLTSFDRWRIVYYDCNEAFVRLNKYKNFIKLDKKIRWSSLMEATNFSDLDDIIGTDLLSILEKEELYDKLKEVNSNIDIMLRVDKIVEKEDEYLYICDVASKKAIKDYKNKLVQVMLGKGISKDDISGILQLDGGLDCMNLSK